MWRRNRVAQSAHIGARENKQIKTSTDLLSVDFANNTEKRHQQKMSRDQTTMKNGCDDTNARHCSRVLVGQIIANRVIARTRVRETLLFISASLSRKCEGYVAEPKTSGELGERSKPSTQIESPLGNIEHSDLGWSLETNAPQVHMTPV